MAKAAKAKVPEINLEQVLEEVAKEKGIEKKSLVDTIEAAILKAAQNTFGANRELEARYNPDTGSGSNHERQRIGSDIIGRNDHHR